MAAAAGKGRELSFSQLVLPDVTADPLRVTGSEARHLLKSLRGRVGDRVRATDGCGHSAWLEIVELGRAGATLRVVGSECIGPPSQRWWLATRAAGPRFDWLVEKAVELGAWSLLPLAADSGSAPRRVERWQRLADAALGQCQAAWGLRVAAPRPLAEILQAPDPGSWAGLVWADLAGIRAGEIQPGSLPDGDLLLVAGPPEGFSGSQRERLERFPGSICIALGERRLRSETAALAGLVWARCTGP